MDDGTISTTSTTTSSIDVEYKSRMTFVCTGNWHCLPGCLVGVPNPCLMKVQFCSALSGFVATGLLTLPFCQDPLIICHHRMLHLLHAESTLWLLSQFLVQWNGKRYIGLVSSSSPKGNLLDGQSKTRLHDMVFHIEGWLTMLQCRQSVCLEKICLFWTLPVSRDNMISLNYKCIRGFVMCRLVLSFVCLG